MTEPKSLQNFDHHQRQIVVLMRAGGEFHNVIEERVYERSRSQAPVFEQEIDDALLAEFDAMRLRRVRFRQSVSVEEEQVAFLQAQGFALILLLIEDAEQHPACFQSLPFSRSLDQQGRIMSRVAVI